MPLNGALALLMFLGASAIGGATVAKAQSNELALCIAIKEDADRLKCFDALAERLTALSDADIDRWEIKRRKDPVDDTDTVYALLSSNEPVGRFGERARLAIGCRSNKPELVIHWGSYLGRDSPEVVTRIDNERAVKTMWLPATGAQSTFLQTNRIPAFLRQMLMAERFVTQTMPYNSGPITAVFTLNGMAEAVKPVLETCKIRLDEKPATAPAKRAGSTGG